jgi:copper resistance protein C
MRIPTALVGAMLLAAGWQSPASAHAIVTGSSLASQPVRAGEATHLLLQFNSSVEIGLSRIFLVSKGDSYQPLTMEQGAKPGEVVVALPALATGDYALKYRILATDGHVTEDVLRFQVLD